MNGDNDRTASFGDEAELEMEERFILVGSDSSPTRSSPEAHPGRVESQWWRRHAQANRAAKTISSIDQLDAVFIGDRLQEADDEDRALVEEFAQSLKQQLRTHQRKSTGSTASQPGKGSGRASAETPVSFDRRSASFSTVGLSVEEIRLLQSSSRREIPRTPPSQAKAIGQSLPSSAERSSAASPISTTGTPARSPISPRLLAFRDGGRPRPPASPLDSTTVHDDSSLVHTNGTARFTSPPPHAVPSSQSKSRPGPSAFFGDSAVRADRSESGTHSLGAALNRDLVLGLRAELAQVLRDRDKLLASVDQYRSEAEKQSEMFRTMSEQLNNAVFILEQTRIDNADLRDALMLEKSRTAKNEKEFQLFARKVKSLQEQNSELLAENDALRSELRKLQYEGATSKEASEFYKQRMSQLLYDNESLKVHWVTLHFLF
ncbi:hypothetical protein DFJ73DRAFT_166953 [Zopfochytrium polystomum]|nr:hypothetical protein DFJ73DRAFT_166953 [Zopfochytrium polystomum]